VVRGRRQITVKLVLGEAKVQST